MVAQEVYNEEIARLAQGRKIKPVAQALIDNQRRVYEQKTKAMGQSFSVYTVIMGSLNGVFEDLFVNMKDRLVPNPYTVAMCKEAHPKRGNQDKKAYKKMIDKWLRQGTTDKDGNYTIQPYPYYSQELSQAVKGFNPLAFEQWAKKHLNGDMSLVENTVDGAIETLQKDVTILRYSIKNEMDAMRLTDSGLKAEVYALYLLGQTIEAFHLALMLIGPIDDWDKLLENGSCDFLQKIDDLTANGHSDTYSHHYHSQMNEALCYWNVRYAEQMCKAVCGEWSHLKEGLTERAIEAIRRRVTSTRFLEDISNSGISNDPEHAREVEQITSMWIYDTGKIPYTILHLDGLKHMNQGWTLEQIDKWLTDDPMVHTTQPVRKQILLTCAIVKAAEDGRLNMEAYNDYYSEKYDESVRRDREKARQTGKSPQDTVVPEATPEATVVDNVNAIVNALCHGMAELEVQKQEEQERIRKHEEINADPLLRLSQKFNVTALKPKTPKQPVTNCNHLKAKKSDDHFAAATKMIERVTVEEQKPAEAEPMTMTPQPPTPKRNVRKWTKEEECYLKNHYKDTSIEEMEKHLWRTEASIRNKYHRMTLSGQWEKEEGTPIPFEQ